MQTKHACFLGLDGVHTLGEVCLPLLLSQGLCVGLTLGQTTAHGAGLYPFSTHTLSKGGGESHLSAKS